MSAGPHAAEGPRRRTLARVLAVVRPLWFVAALGIVGAMAVLAAREVELDRLVLAYLNRLSDLLFILARAAVIGAGRDEPLWRPGA